MKHSFLLQSLMLTALLFLEGAIVVVILGAVVKMVASVGPQLLRLVR
jgi:hypothetical protein